MISFSVSRLEKEEIHLDGVEPPDFLILAGSEPFAIASAMKYSLVISKVSDGALVRGKCSVDISGECGRCLKNVTHTLETEDFDIFVEIPSGVEVCDISEDLRTEMTLALPMNFICDTDCRGLCPVCGVDRNETECSCEDDSTGGSLAWSALDKLKL